MFPVTIDFKIYSLTFKSQRKLCIFEVYRKIYKNNFYLAARHYINMKLKTILMQLLAQIQVRS